MSTDTLCLYVKADALVKILKAPSGKVKLQPVVGQAEVSDSKYSITFCRLIADDVV